MKLAEHAFESASHRQVLMAGLAWLLATSLTTDAATNAALPYNVRVWQTDDGLPQNTVQALAQTPDGFLWVGTQEGLARFDGDRFTVVEDPAAPELKHGSIRALCASRDGSLWVACDGTGLTRLNHGVFEHYSTAQGLPTNATRCLLQSKDGSLWIGTENGLSRYRDGQFTNFTDRQGLGDNSVRALCEDRRGFLRIATKRGLSSLDPKGRLTNRTISTNWNANATRCVCQDRRGNLWVGATKGLNCLAGNRKTLYGPAEGLPDWVVDCLLEDHAGQLWVGTYGGLARIVDGQVVAQTGNETLFDMVNALYEDREENLWVAARDGLFRLTPARFRTYAVQQGLARNNVMSVCEDKAGTIWLGIWDGGLAALQGDKVTAYPPPESLERDSVLSLLESRDGGLWMGMDFTAGLNRFQDGRRILMPKTNRMLIAPVRVIHEDRSGALWIGTSQGLNVLREGRVEVFTSTNGLAGNLVLVIHEDSAGNCWVGTDGGLSCWRGKGFTNYTTLNGLSHNTVGALYEDSQHTLWIGTRGGGLDWMPLVQSPKSNSDESRAGVHSPETEVRSPQSTVHSPEPEAPGPKSQSGGQAQDESTQHAARITHCSSQQGLFSDEIYEILEDDFGYFWMSCRRGIFRVAKKELEDLGRGARKTVTCTAFGKADGLLSVQCNGVAKPSGWKARDGRLWFPTIRGVVAVETRIKPNDNPPPLSIEEVLADRKALHLPPYRGLKAFSQAGADSTPDARPALRQALTIPPGRGELEIRYTALSLQMPEKNRFKYRLDGADSGWIDAGPERVARYYNLSPGNYSFRVIGSNNDGVWNETAAVLDLVLQPHFWQTWWFKVGLLAPIGLVLALLHRLRVARLRGIERLRIQIAANLHDDVGARLTKVAMVTEFVDRETNKTDRIKPHVQTISRTTREIIQAMDEIVWTINPKNDTLEDLASYLFQYAQEYFQDTAIRCRLDFPAQLPDCPLSTEARHNLFMAVKEALNNVLKHARATEVRIALALAESKLSLTIVDNGCGFALGQPHPPGNGLNNMRTRLEQIGGRLLIESHPGSGTKIAMETEVG